MRRLPIVFLFLTAFFVALPAAAAWNPVGAVNGTWLVTQSFSFPEAAVGVLDAAPGGDPLVDVMHVDVDGEVRELSGVFHSQGCGSVLTTSSGVALKLPFSASTGIGDWAVTTGQTVRMNYVHYLYDCIGKALGYAWVVRVGLPIYQGPELSEGPDEPPPPDDQPPAAAPTILAWEGTIEVGFFDLRGQPLALTFVDGDAGVTGLVGTFRAVKAGGEPVQ